jgi:hypothetical protein
MQTLMEELPNKKIVIKQQNLRSLDDLKLVSIALEHILISPDNRAYALIEGDDKDIAVPLNPYEGSMLSFVFKGLYKNSHIQTIHQMYSKHLKDQAIQIESIYIESKVGDILYASIHFVDKKHRRYYVICSLVDALIMSILNKIALNAVKDTWDKIDSFDDWNYEEYIVDWSPE